MKQSASPVSILIGSGSWLLRRRIILSLVNLAATAFLARLLVPQDFGKVTLALSVLNLISILGGAGLDDYIIQHEDDKRVQSSIFRLTLLSGLAIASLSWGIGVLFLKDEIWKVILPYALVNFLTEFYSIIPKALLRKSFKYKELTQIQTGLTIIEILGKPLLAFAGMGALSLVIPGAIIGPVLFVLLLLKSGINWKQPAQYSHWKQSWQFIRFSISSRFLTRLLNEGDNLIVASVFGEAALGFYALAFQAANYINTSFTFIVGDVVVPIFSSVKNQPEKLKQAFRDIIQLLSFASFPLFGWLFVIHQEFADLFWGEPYHLAGQLLAIMLIFSAFRILNSGSTGLTNSIGKPGATFLIQIIYIPALLLVLFLYGQTENPDIIQFCIILTMGRVLLSLITMMRACKISGIPIWLVLQQILPGFLPIIIPIALGLAPPLFDQENVIFQLIYRSFIYFISLSGILYFVFPIYLKEMGHKLREALFQNR